MPTTSLPGIGASIRIERAARAIARSSARASIRDSLTFFCGLDLVLGDDRAGVRADDPGVDPEAAQLRLDVPRCSRRGPSRRRSCPAADLEELDRSAGSSVVERRRCGVERLDGLDGGVAEHRGRGDGRAGRCRPAAGALEPPPPPGARPAQIVWLIGAGAGARVPLRRRRWSSRDSPDGSAASATVAARPGAAPGAGGARRPRRAGAVSAAADVRAPRAARGASRVGRRHVEGEEEPGHAERRAGRRRSRAG